MPSQGGSKICEARHQLTFAQHQGKCEIYGRKQTAILVYSNWESDSNTVLRRDARRMPQRRLRLQTEGIVRVFGAPSNILVQSLGGNAGCVSLVLVQPSLGDGESTTFRFIQPPFVPLVALDGLGVNGEFALECVQYPSALGIAQL